MNGKIGMKIVPTIIPSLLSLFIASNRELMVGVLDSKVFFALSSSEKTMELAS
jgi:hypothetical protein